MSAKIVKQIGDTIEKSIFLMDDGWVVERIISRSGDKVSAMFQNRIARRVVVDGKPGLQWLSSDGPTWEQRDWHRKVHEALSEN